MPTIFRAGNIVDTQVNFIGVPLSSGHRQFICMFSGIAFLDRGCALVRNQILFKIIFFDNFCMQELMRRSQPSQERAVAPIIPKRKIPFMESSSAKRIRDDMSKMNLDDQSE